MRLALVAFLVAGCVSQDGSRSPLLPTEFHLFGSHSWADSSGSIGPRGNPDWNLDTAGSSDGWAIGAGFTWFIGPLQSSPATRDLVRELKAWRAADLRLRAPIPVTDPVTESDPDHDHEPEEPPAPEPVDDEDASIWIPLIGAVSLLVTAVAGYLGRARIPVVRRYTAAGRATRAAECIEDDDPPEA